MARDDIAFTYDAAQNPDEHTIAGVGLRDLTQRDYAKLPPHVRAAVDKSSWYTRVAALDAPQDTESDASAPIEPTVENDDAGAENAASDVQGDASDGETAAHVPPAVDEAAKRTSKKRPTEHK